ncbi:MAG: SusC/RagA family TonB-linked outer membrane protein, partial [Sphingobacterium sp.]|nr:SusC/RagA family TonB-linked outer membrane protein [Sphingobacterium sp.]
DDIEDINILKDAAATAQYGARAMNGVVVIRTKKGRVGKVQVNYTGNFSLNPKPKYSSYNIMNSVDQMSVNAQLYDYGWYNHSSASRAENGGVFRKMYDKIYEYDQSKGQFGLENTPEARETFLKRYALSNTDWFDILFNNSFQQEHSLNFNGGSESIQTYFSTSYLKDNGWAKGNNVERWTANLNNTFKLSDKISVNMITTGAIRNQMAPGTVTRTSNPVEGKYSRDFDINPFSYALNTSRTMTAYDDNGDLEFFTRNFAPFNVLHELDNNKMRLSMLDLKLQGGLSYKIIDGLTFNTLGSMRYAKTGQEHMVTGSSNMAEAYRAGLEDSDTRGRNRFLYRNPADPAAEPVTVLPYGGFYNTNDDFMKAYTFRNSLEYNFEAGTDHIFNAFLAQEIRINRRQNKTNIGYGYQYDKGGVPFIDPLAIEMSVANNIPYYTMRNLHDRASNYLARFAYAYKERYSVNGTFRYDGSNQLGNTATARWLPTWNLSGAWRLSNENFYQESGIASVMNKVSIRGTYGLVANINGATSAGLVLKSGSSLRPYKNENETLLRILHLANDELTWEKSYEANIGLDLGFWQDRFAIAFDLYNRNSFDLIYEMRTPAIGGEYRKMVNYADMNNKGVELSLAYNGNIGNVKWNSNFNFGYSKNKVTKLNANPNIFDLVGTNGGPTLDKAYRGLYSIQFAELNSEKGYPTFIGSDGITNYVDPQGYDYGILKYEGPTEPLFSGGFSNTLTYKNFSVFALFTFATGNKIRLNPYFNSSYADTDALPQEFKLRWVLDGDNQVPALADKYTNIELAGKYPYNSYNYSTERVAKGDLLKLKTVRVSYNLPDAWLSKYKIRNSSLSLVANNFWLIYADKKLNGQDPEFFSTGGVALPVNRMYTLSFKFGF